MGELYRYSGLEARWYDELDELSDFDDLDFYRWFVENGLGKTLDVGCGTGRILLPLKEAGYEVVGLDSSPEMLEICREQLRSRGLTADLTVGDMWKFDFGKGEFATVLLPGFSIQLLLDDADLLSCLTCCREHLAEGGSLVVPTYLPWEMIWDGREVSPLEERRTVSISESGESQVALQGWSLDAIAQRIRLLNRWERRGASGEILEAEDKEMTIRWDMPHEMMTFFSEAGFEDVSVYGDFSFDQPEEDADSVIYVARRG